MIRTRRKAGTNRSLATAAFTVGLLVTTAFVGGTANAATGSGSGVVSTGSAQVGLNVRSAPNTSLPPRSSLAGGSRFTIVCQQRGQSVVGSVRTTDLWNRLSTGLWVSDAFVRRTSAPIQVCTRLPAAVQGVVGGLGWVSPIGGLVGSGFRTKERPSHDGVDIAAARNTPIHAVAAGTVITVLCNTSTKSCDMDGGLNAKGCGWYVEIQHADRVVTRYCHLVRQPPVTEGEQVLAGQVIGNVGSSGNSSGPHLHFEIHTGAGTASSANATEPMAFLKAKGVVLS